MKMSLETLFIGFLILAATWIVTGCVDPSLTEDDDEAYTTKVLAKCTAHSAPDDECELDL